MTDGTFRDKVVIITGASSGIGRALALKLAGQGACLALASRDAQRLADVAVKCHERGGRALVVPTDVGDERQCRQLIERTCAEYRRIERMILPC